MILLSVTLRNHRSLRDEVRLDLTQPGFSRLVPGDGDWAGRTYRLGAIFGGNATGKSALVSGLQFIVSAITHSAGWWLSRPEMVRHPFALTQDGLESSSAYQIDFVYDGRRHEYGFEIDRDGVVAEWLCDVPTSRRRTLLQRRRGEKTIFRYEARKIEVADRELVLSRARAASHGYLAQVAQALVSQIKVLDSGATGRRASVSRVTRDIVSGRSTPEDVAALLRVADAGVEQVEVEERPVAWRRKRASQEQGGDVLTRTVLMHPELTFTHRGAEDVAPLEADDESDGTLAWLALAVPALAVLRHGGVLVVDEIDSSLHPYLVDVILDVFADTEVNTRGAQLLFTSHDTHLLSPRTTVPLDQGQVWVVDKMADGASEVVSLDEYPRHSDANLERRYLQGRYGGVPRLSPSVLAAMVED